MASVKVWPIIRGVCFGVIIIVGIMSVVSVYPRGPGSVIIGYRSPKENAPQPSAQTRFEHLRDQSKHLNVTKQLIRKFVRENGVFPEQCAINSTDYTWMGCSFPALKSSIPACLKASGIKRVAVFGDSQGKRTIDALNEMMTRCVKTKESHGRISPLLPSLDYYVENSSLPYQFDNTSAKKFCSGCDGFTLSCSGVSFEYMGYQSLNGTTITLPPKANTFLEFLMKVHLKDQPPDMVIFIIPFNHIKNYLNKRMFVRQFPKVLELIKRTMTHAKSIVILPGLYEHESKRNQQGRTWFMRKFFGHIATEQIYFLIKGLAHVMQETSLLEDPRFTSFINLNNATKYMESHCIDGVHYKRDTYITILKALFGILCSDAML